MECYKCGSTMISMFEEVKGLYLKRYYKCPKCNNRETENIKKIIKMSWEK